MSHKGIIKRLVQTGFGFVRQDGTGTEYFFHRSGVDPNVGFDALREGDRVEFEEESSERGPRATGVSLMGIGNR